MSNLEWTHKGITIEVTPEMLIAYNNAREKGYTGSFAEFLNEEVKKFVEMRSQ